MSVTITCQVMVRTSPRDGGSFSSTWGIHTPLLEGCLKAPVPLLFSLVNQTETGQTTWEYTWRKHFFLGKYLESGVYLHLFTTTTSLASVALTREAEAEVPNWWTLALSPHLSFPQLVLLLGLKSPKEMGQWSKKAGGWWQHPSHPSPMKPSAPVLLAASAKPLCPHVYMGWGSRRIFLGYLSTAWAQITPSHLLSCLCMDTRCAVLWQGGPCPKPHEILFSTPAFCSQCSFLASWT